MLQVKRLRLRFGPRHTLEASVAEIWRRGGRMTRNGLRGAAQRGGTATAPGDDESQEGRLGDGDHQFGVVNVLPVQRHDIKYIQL